MIVFKCKMCGGTLKVNNIKTVGVCEYCGTKQTLPKLDNERKMNLYDRANHFRRNDEFDKAMSIYEQILNEDRTDAESYWSIVLCRYGIEYVEDPTTHKRIPTVNRTQLTSIFDDEDYKCALQYADGYQREVYENEATVINEIQKGILAISQKEEPFDVFICYKETDKNGRRTQDSVLAQELYYELLEEGFKVFFAKITLEDKLGQEYEPYIFAALNSAKVMVALGTKPEHFNAVWVKNEWSRYLALIKKGENKMLIPAYRDMDPYDLPEEFSHLQAQDMSKLGFMQDLVRGIKKIAKADTSTIAPVVRDTVVTGNVNIESLLKRVFMFLEDGDWGSADEYCEKILDIEPENAQAYLGKLMVELQVRKLEGLKGCAEPFSTRNNYKKVLRFADRKLVDKLKADIAYINERNEESYKNNVYQHGLLKMKEARTEEEFETVYDIFDSIANYKDANELRDQAEVGRKTAIYEVASNLAAIESIARVEQSIGEFERILGFSDSQAQIDKCYRKIEEIKEREEKERLEHERIAEQERIEAKKKAKRNKKIAVVSVVVVVSIIIVLLVLVEVIIPTNKYKKAITLLNEKKYEEAIVLFDELKDYKDSAEQLQLAKTEEASEFRLAKLNEAIVLIEEGNYEEGYAILESVEETEKINENIYQRAVQFYNSHDYQNAMLLLRQITEYKDSTQMLSDIQRLIIRAVNVGDEFVFGEYNEIPITWKVLDKVDGKILVLSKFCLGDKAYEDTEDDEVSTNWSKCSLRRELNHELINEIFNNTEKTMICATNVVNNDNAEHGTDGGPDTTDKLFLLSINEVNRYFSNTKARVTSQINKSENDGWWTRSPGWPSCAIEITSSGKDFPNLHVRSVIGIRPAMWLKNE